MRKRVPDAGLSLVVAVVLLLITMPAGSLASPPAAQESQGLFVPVPAPQGEGPEIAAQPAVIRSRLVEVDLSLLAGSSPRRLALNLFDDVVLDVDLQEAEPLPDAGQAWRGRIEGEELSQVVLVRRDDLLVGDVFLPGAVYRVRSTGGGLHAVSQMDQSALPPEMEPVPVPVPPAPADQPHDVLSLIHISEPTRPY